jgi:Fe2+ transport system protein FeoA
VNAEYLIPLELLGPGEWADVAELHGELGWVGRMAELGLQPGGRICMLRCGSPCLLLTGNCRLCLRGEDLLRILVRPVQPAADHAEGA